MNTRRTWLFAGAALAPFAAMNALRAQQNAPVVIAFLSATGREGLDPFNEGMAALGWKMGTNYVVEARWAGGRVERLPELAQELLAKKPALFVALPSHTVAVLMAAAPGMPIVLATGDPLANGLVSNLARPGGMVTGMSNVTSDLNLKLAELLVETVPKLQREAFFADPAAASHAADLAKLRRAAEKLRVEALVVDVARPEDIEPAVARLAKDKAQALVLLSSVWLRSHYPKTIALALAQRWPVVSSVPDAAKEGALFAYGPNRGALFRRSAFHVDRILKGAKPGDLPIEQPTTFDMVLNLKTARVLGITVPRSVMGRVTEVIE